MSNLPAQRATTLEQAFRLCDVQPLAGEDFARYYVDLTEVRNTESINEVSVELRLKQPGEFGTVLFTGHRGCGKSTELKRIQAELARNYQIIYIEVDEELDLNDASYTDIYLVILRKLEGELRQMGLRFNRELLSSFEQWFKEITKESEETVDKAVSITSDAQAGIEIPFLTKLTTKLLATIKGSNTQKTTIRETLERNVSRLQADLNLLLGDAHRKLLDVQPNKKGFLFIFDNLDRVTPKVARHLFVDYAAQLQALDYFGIYTVPISAIYSGANLSNSFGSVNVMPMVNIYEFDRDRATLQYNDRSLGVLRQILNKRLDLTTLFDSEDVVQILLKASGGHVRQLMQLSRGALLKAMTRQHLCVMADDAKRAIADEQFNFERLIQKDHYPRLVEVYRKKNLDNDEIGQELIFNLSVLEYLEYNGGRRWNYPNPLVQKIEQFQAKLTSSTT
ncbi:MAG: ATP-binding protein [Spirulinaceae cyanobacterium]